MPHHRTARVAAVVLLAASLGGCGLSTRIYLKDDSAMAATRATWRMGEAAGFEVGAARVRASGTQRLDDSETVYFEDRSVTGPVLLNHRTTHEHAHLAYKHRIPLGSRFELEWLAGATAVRHRWESTSERPTDPLLANRTTWRGAVGGLLGRLKLEDHLSLELRGVGAAAVRSSVTRGEFGFSELVLAWRPAGGPLLLRGGFAQFSSDTRPGLGDSEQTLRVRGPYLNLGLEF